MKTRTDIHAGANSVGIPNPLAVCKQQKEYWINQYNYMQNVLANCHPSQAQFSQHPPSGGGWVGGQWYADRSGICG